MFRTINADPPWNEQGGGKIKRGAQRHYPLMKTRDIAPTMSKAIQSLGGVHENAHLYMWVTNNFLRDGFAVMDALGFRYVTNVVWAKEQMSIGQYFRGKHELMLFGVRGKGLDPSVATDARDIPSCIVAPHERGPDGKRIHSRKPEVFRDLIERRSKGPFLELFARTHRPGWESWGDEVPESVLSTCPT